MDWELDKLIALLNHFDVMVDSILQTEVLNEAREAIADEVLYSVYKYDAAPIFKSHRRWKDGGIADPQNITGESFPHGITITDSADLQNIWGAGEQGLWSADVTTIVQNGSEAFNQPGPRPFLEDAIEDAVNEGRIDSAIKTGLMRFKLDVD